MPVDGERFDNKSFDCGFVCDGAKVVSIRLGKKVMGALSGATVDVITTGCTGDVNGEEIFIEETVVTGSTEELL